MFRSLFLILPLLWFLTSCGVMNNPEQDSSPKGDAETTNEALPVFKDFIPTLILTPQNNIIAQNFAQYHIFTQETETQNFLHELNTTTQTLPETDRNIIHTWISYANSLNTNYDTQNLLFYPLILSQNCPLHKTVTTAQNNFVLTLTTETDKCTQEQIYHPLIYNIDKQYDTIIISPDGKDIILDNQNY